MALKEPTGLGNGTYFGAMSGFDLQPISANVIMPRSEFSGPVAEPKLPAVREIARKLSGSPAPMYERSRW